MAMASENHATRADIVIADVPQTELSPRRHPERPPITTNPEKLGGTPTIAGTRLPVTALIDHLILGYDIDEFIAEFDGADRGDVQAVLLKIKEALEAGLLAESVKY
jgi:uncharacterized protein (DUF433 family)